MTFCQEAAEIVRRAKSFGRATIVLYDRDPPGGALGPVDDLIGERRMKARAAVRITPHIRPDGWHLTQNETADVRHAFDASMPVGHLVVVAEGLRVAADQTLGREWRVRQG